MKRALSVFPTGLETPCIGIHLPSVLKLDYKRDTLYVVIGADST